MFGTVISRKTIIIPFFFLIVFGASISATPHAASTDYLTPTYLRCEYRVDPVGIDDAHPRLSWIAESRTRGQFQTAYRVIVSSDRESLEEGIGELWNSGRVESDNTTSVVYAGERLQSGQQCFWRVKVWDKDGKESPWSETATWSMGLLSQSDWKADWIGYDKKRQPEVSKAPLDEAKWIWFAGDQGSDIPAGNRVFMTQVPIPEEAIIDKAELLVAADDRHWFNINGASASIGEGWERLQLVDVTQRMQPGMNSIRVQVENASRGPAGLIAKLTVTTTKGKTYTWVTDGSWRCTDSPGEDWHKREIAPDAWPNCRVIGDYGCEPWGTLQYEKLFLPPPVYLRTTFEVESPVRRAVVYATALGLYDLHLNGARVTEDYFNPGWTDYTKRVYYRAYDVTNLVGPGENALGAILADGWYSGYIGWKRIRDHYGEKPRFRAQLHIEYVNGKTDIVSTGRSWKASTGPIREADFLMGETYDARMAMDNWCEPGFNADDWDRVDTGAEMRPVVEAHPGPPVIAIEEFRAIEITEPQPDTYVLNLGQNFAGVPRLTLKGKPGQTIRLRFAERLNPDGTVYTTNLREARVIDTYTCCGEGVEVWQPRFTFHGFQYVEITGLDSPPTRDTLVGVALSSDTPDVGSFECSDPMLNQLVSNIFWTQRANFIEIPTDCPQRDERLGWTGDAQVYVRTATLNTDVQAFFDKWLIDLTDAQREDGQFPMVAPLKVAGGDGGPAWADAGVICPWTIYWVYGDHRILERQYDSMTRFIEFCKNRSTDDLLPPERFHCFGDWLSIKADTPTDVICTAYFAYSTKLTARAAEILGKTKDALKYNRLHEQIKSAFNKAYVSSDGRIKGDTQCCYVLALAFDLLDAEKAKLAARHLVEDIESRDWHLSTGFIGTKDLMLALEKIGRNDVAYRLIHNDTFPSWGFSIRHGATSIWERWDGWTPEEGFQNPGMNSFAHYSFGAVYQWMVENIGGIRSAAPAYREVVIKPQPGGRLTYAKVGYKSIQGPIQSCWELADDALLLDVTIPVNTSATIYVPTENASEITESGRPISEVHSVKFIREKEGSAVFKVGSGKYRFASPYSRTAE